MSLGEIIKQRREELDLTQDVVAQQADISKPYMSNIETNKTKNPPTDGVLLSLERVLKFHDGELIRIAHRQRTPSDVLAEHEMLETDFTRLRGALLDLLHARKTPAGGEGQEWANLSAEVKTLLGAKGASANIGRASSPTVVPVINNVAAGYPHHFTDLDYPPSIADEYVRCPDVHDSQAFAARVVGDSMEPRYHEGDIVVFSPNTPAANGQDCFVRFEAEGGTTFKRVYQDDADTIRLQPLNNRYPSQTVPRQQITGLWPAVFRIEKLR